MGDTQRCEDAAGVHIAPDVVLRAWSGCSDGAEVAY
jgi:hypothetical protein